MFNDFYHFIFNFEKLFNQIQHFVKKIFHNRQVKLLDVKLQDNFFLFNIMAAFVFFHWFVHRLYLNPLQNLFQDLVD